MLMRKQEGGGICMCRGRMIQAPAANLKDIDYLDVEPLVGPLLAALVPKEYSLVPKEYSLVPKEYSLVPKEVQVKERRQVHQKHEYTFLAGLF